MRAGKLRQRVRVEAPGTSTADGGGGYSAPWESKGELYAFIEFVQSMRIAAERVQQGVEASTPIARIHVRNCALSRSIQPQWRVIDTRSGDEFEVESVQDFDGDGHMLAITAIRNGTT